METKYLQGYKDLTEELTVAESLKCDKDLREGNLLTLLLYNIDYDISEEDCEDNGMTREEILNSLPEELEIKLEYTEDEQDLQEQIEDEICGQTGYLVNSYSWDLLEVRD